MFRISYISENRDWHSTFRINNNDSLHSFLALNSLQCFFHLSLQTEKAQINRRLQLLFAFHQRFLVMHLKIKLQKDGSNRYHLHRSIQQSVHTLALPFLHDLFSCFPSVFCSSLIYDYNLVETWNCPLIFPSLLLPNPPTTSCISSSL